MNDQIFHPLRSRQTMWLACLWPAAMGVVLMAAEAGALQPDDAEAAVESGREALDQWWGYPWYDAETDAVRRINVKSPRNWDWLWDWLSNLGWNWSGTAEVIRWLAWAALAVLLCVLVYLSIRVYLNRETALARAAAEKSAAGSISDLERLEALPFRVDRTSGDLLDEARRHYQEGNFAQAVVYLFSYQLLELDRRQIIRLARGKTNRQYLREARRHRAAAEFVEPTMVAFEEVFFGNHPLPRPRFEACWSRLGEFQKLLAVS